MIVPEAHAPRISSAHTATNLSIDSGGIIAVSLPGASNALDISTDDAANLTTLDSHAKKLQIKTPTLELANENGGFTASETFSIHAGDPENSSLVATASAVTMGTQVDANGAKVELDAQKSRLSTTETAIRETGGTNMYRAPRHEFFVNENPIVTMADKITFHVDVDIEGAFNSIAGDQTILQVEDPIIQLAAKLDTEADVAQNPSGVVIDTVPATGAGNVTYMSRFKAEDGSNLFVGGDGQVDVAKAVSSGAFVKQVARLHQEMDYDEPQGTFLGSAPTFSIMQECM